VHLKVTLQLVAQLLRHVKPNLVFAAIVNLKDILLFLARDWPAGELNCEV